MKLNSPLLALLLIASTSAAQVTVLNTASSATLNDGILTARLDKNTGGIVSLTFDDIELLSKGSEGIYWEPKLTANPVFRLIDDPSNNGGRRVEVAVSAKYSGRPGTPAADMEVHYALSIANNTALYAWIVLDHPAAYPDLRMEEARVALKLNPEVLDRPIGGNKAGPSTLFGDPPVFGWTSTRYAYGIWMINPSTEYLNGGPAHQDLGGPIDSKETKASPLLPNIWHGSGGSDLFVPSGMAWKKIIGPFPIYVNAGGGADGLWKDAISQAHDEQNAWPYTWVNDPEYPHAAERGSLSGRLVRSPDRKLSRAWAGLAASPYRIPGDNKPVTWRTDGRNYEYWARPDANGKFLIRAVRPGTYTLHAVSEGVPGEYTRAEVTVKAGQTVDLGDIAGKPVR